MKHPTVSVVIPTYNASPYVVETIGSVLNQTFSDFEIIVIDDHSSDNTVELVLSVKDDRIKLIVNSENSGAGATRTRGLRAAKGRYVALLDADDLWAPFKLAQQIEHMAANGHAITYTGYDLIDSKGTKFADSGRLPRSASYNKLLSHCFIRTSSLVYDADIIGRDVTFPNIRKRQDFLFFLALLKRAGPAYLVDQASCSYRIHSDGISSKKFANVPYQWAAYREHERLGLLRCVALMGQWFIRSGLVVTSRTMRHGTMS